VKPLSFPRPKNYRRFAYKAAKQRQHLTFYTLYYLWPSVRVYANDEFQAQGHASGSTRTAPSCDMVFPNIKSHRPPFHDDFPTPMREIWDMQYQTPKTLWGNTCTFLLLEHPRFRAGFDFLLIRELSGHKNWMALGELVVKPLQAWFRKPAKRASSTTLILTPTT